MICVIATVELAEGRRDDFLAEFGQLTAKVLAEPGCLEYQAMVDVPTNVASQPPIRDHVVTVVEKWESIEALEAHLMAAHMMDFRNTTRQMRVGATLQILQPA
jgi:quinol monooxygenase YgiN